MRRYQPAPRRDQGFTLVEMLVTVVLLSIVGALVTSITISSTRTARFQEDKTRSLMSAKVGMERVTREIRGANSMTAAAPRSLTFVTKVGTVRREVTLAVVSVPGGGTDLLQTVKRRDLATETSDTVTTTKVLGGLAIGLSEGVFTYTDATGMPLTPVTSSPVTYAPANVNTVGVRIVLKRETNGKPTELYQLVSIRNLEA